MIYMLSRDYKHISVGHNQLDMYIGGTSIGAIILMEEDLKGIHSESILKLFIAQGFMDNHKMFVSDSDIDTQQLLNNIPVPLSHKDNNILEKSENNLDIAWRYKNLKFNSQPIMPEFTNIQSGKFDLTVTSSYSECSNSSNIDVYDPFTYILSKKGQSIFVDASGVYEGILNAISKFGETRSLQNKPSYNVLRVVLNGLGSPFYLNESSLEMTARTISSNLCQFLICLKSMLIPLKATVIISMSINTFKDNPYLLERIETLCDTVLYFESFVPLYQPINVLSTNYDGAFHIKKISNLYNLPYKIGSKDLVYKLKKKALLIERLHMPPDFQLDTWSTSNSLPCSDPGTFSIMDFKSSNIEF